MPWIAPSEKDTADGALEKRLWDAAEQAMPAPHFAETVFHSARPKGILRLIFLRFAAPRAKLKKASASARELEATRASNVPEILEV